MFGALSLRRRDQRGSLAEAHNAYIKASTSRYLPALSARPSQCTAIRVHCHQSALHVRVHCYHSARPSECNARQSALLSECTAITVHCASAVLPSPTSSMHTLGHLTSQSTSLKAEKVYCNLLNNDVVTQNKQCKARHHRPLGGAISAFAIFGPR